MKQRTLLIILVLISTLTVSAYDAEINGIYYKLTSEPNEAEVTSNPQGYTGSVVIPATVTYNGAEYSVTSIGDPRGFLFLQWPYLRYHPQQRDQHRLRSLP